MLLSSDLDCLTDELFGKLNNISRKPPIKRKTLNIFMRTEHNDEIFCRIDWAMGETDGDEDLTGLSIDKNQKSLYVFHEILEVCHRYSEDKNLVFGLCKIKIEMISAVKISTAFSMNTYHP